MKTTLLALCAGFLALAAQATHETSSAQSALATNELGASAAATQAAETSTASIAAKPNMETEGLVLNFRNAPLDMVLDYLSKAAGFVIIKEAHVSGTVNVISEQPLSRDEAVDLLNSVLNRNGYGALRNGRTLAIISKDELKTRGIPVVLWNGEPGSIPRTDEIITAILPVRFVEAAQLMKDIQPLISPQTAMTANESGNSIVITDTQANIHRVAEVIKDIDMGAEDVTVVKVFHLEHSNPDEMADLVSTLFPDDSKSGTAQAPMQFRAGLARFLGGGAGGGGGPISAGAQNSAAEQNARIKKRNRVIAAADSRTSSLVVTAAKDVMDQIEAVVTELDARRGDNPTIAMFKLENAEPNDALQVLQDIFNKNGAQNNNSTRNNQQNNILQNRSIQQSQQYNSGTTTRNGLGSGGSGGGGLSGFGGGGGGL